MNDIAKISNFYALRPPRFPYLEIFDLRREIVDGRSSDYQLRLQFAPAQKGLPRLELQFLGVRNIRVGNLDGTLALLIDVRAIREDQLEGVAFKVQEKEHEAFSFYCSDFLWKVLEGT